MKNEEHNVSMAEVACHTPTPRKSADDYVKTLIEAKQVVDLWALHAPGLYVATRPRKHHWPLSCQQLHTASVKCIRRFYVSKITQRAFRSWLLEANECNKTRRRTSAVLPEKRLGCGKPGWPFITTIKCCLHPPKHLFSSSG